MLRKNLNREIVLYMLGLTLPDIKSDKVSMTAMRCQDELPF